MFATKQAVAISMEAHKLRTLCATESSMMSGRRAIVTHTTKMPTLKRRMTWIFFDVDMVMFHKTGIGSIINMMSVIMFAMAIVRRFARPFWQAMSLPGLYAQNSDSGRHSSTVEISTPMKVSTMNAQAALDARCMYVDPSARRK